MLFDKLFNEIDFDDIKELKTRQIPESDVLDYKREKIADNSLIKHVCAFSNTNGGYIIYGISELKKGGPPKEIIGIDSGLDVERLERILTTNIHPRLMIRTKKISNEDGSKVVLLINY